jgi:two-component system, cell cycle sensor histidine kinase and response regulator CckA
MTQDLVVLIGGQKPELFYSLATILRAEGYLVRTTVGTIQAIEALYSDPPRLILVPPRLEGITGFELCRRLRRHYATHLTPLLFVTGDASEQSAAFRSGASDVISMPPDAAEVLARVRTHLELTAYRMENLFKQPSSHQDDAHDDGWIRLAMQAGRMYAFEWDALTDAIRRSHDSTAILGIPHAFRDTGTSFFQRVHPDDRERFHQFLSILSSAFDMYDTQFRFLRPDGKEITLRESGRGLFDASGRLARVIGITADVTEQVAARKDLEQSQTDLLQLIQRLPMAVAIANANGRIEYINNRFTRVFGYQLDDVADPAAWWERAYPDEDYRREVLDQWIQTIDAANQDYDIPSREYQITGKDGMRHSVEVFGAKVAQRKLILFDDVTEHRQAEAALRESEEQFRVMANTAPVMIWVSGTDKLCTFFNQRWLEFTGRAIEQELGNGWAEGVHPADLDACLAVYNAAFDNRETFQMEYRLRGADGEYRWILDNGSPRFTRDEAFAGYIGSAIDITDSKRRQGQTLNAQKLESLGVFAGGVAHDFNNFLGCILADTEITISDLDVNSPARSGLERIRAVALRASQVVGQIMDYVTEGPEGFEPVNLPPLVEEMVKLLHVCIPKQIKLNFEMPPSLVIQRANAAQLRQLVMNLILNAGEAIGQHNGVITVTGRRVSQYRGKRTPGRTYSESDCVCLEITDTGMGMTQEVRQRIFDPFFSTKLPGRGFGLAAVQGIVHNHGGSMEVKSNPGEGTTFRVLLPAGRQHAGVMGATSTPRSLSHKGSILIVEDEEPLRFSVAKMLIKTGFSVLEAGDGDLAVDLIHDRTQDIALVLLDLTLPGKSSEEVCAELQRVRPEAKVILTSAFSRASVSGFLKVFEHQMFIRKPYQLGQLVTVVQQAFPLEEKLTAAAFGTGK